MNKVVQTSNTKLGQVALTNIAQNLFSFLPPKENILLRFLFQSGSTYSGIGYVRAQWLQIFSRNRQSGVGLLLSRSTGQLYFLRRDIIHDATKGVFRMLPNMANL